MTTTLCTHRVNFIMHIQTNINHAEYLQIESFHKSNESTWCATSKSATIQTRAIYNRNTTHTPTYTHTSLYLIGENRNWRVCVFIYFSIDILSIERIRDGGNVANKPTIYWIHFSTVNTKQWLLATVCVRYWTTRPNGWSNLV